MARRALQGGPRWARGRGLFLGPRSGGSVFPVTGDAVTEQNRSLLSCTKVTKVISSLPSAAPLFPGTRHCKSARRVTPVTLVTRTVALVLVTWGGVYSRDSFPNRFLFHRCQVALHRCTLTCFSSSEPNWQRYIYSTYIQKSRLPASASVTVSLSASLSMS